MAEHYDVIVVGVGGMGSAAVHHIARRGRRVLGLEQFDIPHSLGSSHGVNRIIRLAYYEHPSYVPLLRRSFELWRELERDAGERLLVVTGGIDASPEDGQVYQGSLRSCREHGLDHEVLTGTEVNRRFPGYNLPATHRAVFQPDAGFVLSERAIVAHVTGAHQSGADVRARESVLSWTADGDGIGVTTDRSEYRAGKLVIAGGAWAGRLVPGLAPVAVPERQVLAWFQPLRPHDYEPDSFPVFIVEVPDGQFYGFPVYGIPGFKVGKFHHRHEDTDPDATPRQPDAADEAPLRDFTTQYFPGAAGPTMALKTCLFTNSPDEHFIIDMLPNHPNVVVAAGFSGHGYKFATVVGEILADLALDGSTGHDIGMFRATRFDEDEA